MYVFNHDHYQRHRLTNVLHTWLWLGAIAFSFYIIMLLFAVPPLFMVVLLLLWLPILLSQNYAPDWALRLQRAQPMNPVYYPRLASIVEEISRRAGLPKPPRLFWIPSQRLNALSVGNQQNSAVAMTEGLLQALDERQLIGVLAHEISHIRHNDLWVLNVTQTIGHFISFMSTLGMFLIFFNIPLYLLSDYQFPWGLLLILILLPKVVELLQLGLSRTREFSADLSAAELTQDPYGLATALQIIEQREYSILERLFGIRQSVPVPEWLKSHPDTEQRIRRLMSLYDEYNPSEHHHLHR